MSSFFENKKNLIIIGGIILIAGALFLFYRKIKQNMKELQNMVNQQQQALMNHNQVLNDLQMILNYHPDQSNNFQNSQPNQSGKLDPMTAQAERYRTESTQAERYRTESTQAERYRTESTRSDESKSISNRRFQKTRDEELVIEEIQDTVEPDEDSEEKIEDSINLDAELEEEFKELESTHLKTEE
jgi:LPXTG-motif cell wall-anchored protein